MAKDKQGTSSPERRAITDSTTLFKQWDVSNVKEFAEGEIVSKEGMVSYEMDQQVFDKTTGQATGAIEAVAYIFVKIGDAVKPTKLRAKLNRELTTRYGSDPKKWIGKKIVAKYKDAFGMDYLDWSPEGKIS